MHTILSADINDGQRDSFEDIRSQVYHEKKTICERTEEDNFVLGRNK